MPIAIVYGSLREGAYNHDSFKRYYPDGYNKIGEATIKGYDLYSLGSYPFICESENPEQPLVVDAFECSQECYDDITRMELGAGYNAVQITVELTNGKEVTGTIYTFDSKDYAYHKVESGDWIEYKTK